MLVLPAKASRGIYKAQHDCQFLIMDICHTSVTDTKPLIFGNQVVLTELLISILCPVRNYFGHEIGVNRRV